MRESCCRGQKRRLHVVITLEIVTLDQKVSLPWNVSVVGWMVMMADDPEHPDLFLLTDSEKGESLK